ncbi:uncharacterized protein BP5553_09336 [Venustampulla echinocandica]|uniref:Uncharacterized protein n=1 Tax=Venustampulla echinocandica TaxID=2656787 RepID=A0A370TCG9_9HELO|nr:uncharacterized protein BP5553_09336 [Venustampulla echinocandica]RDL31934.1 hypothetical protein BP5553_09336 [Venustampulla echinocandica]
MSVMTPDGKLLYQRANIYMTLPNSYPDDNNPNLRKPISLPSPQDAGPDFPLPKITFISGRTRLPAYRRVIDAIRKDGKDPDEKDWKAASAENQGLVPQPLLVQMAAHLQVHKGDSPKDIITGKVALLEIVLKNSTNPQQLELSRFFSLFPERWTIQRATGYTVQTWPYLKDTWFVPTNEEGQPLPIPHGASDLTNPSSKVLIVQPRADIPPNMRSVTWSPDVMKNIIKAHEKIDGVPGTDKTILALYAPRMGLQEGSSQGQPKSSTTPVKQQSKVTPSTPLGPRDDISLSHESTGTSADDLKTISWARSQIKAAFKSLPVIDQILANIEEEEVKRKRSLLVPARNTTISPPVRNTTISPQSQANSTPTKKRKKGTNTVLIHQQPGGKTIAGYNQHLIPKSLEHPDSTDKNDNPEDDDNSEEDDDNDGSASDSDEEDSAENIPLPATVNREPSPASDSSAFNSEEEWEFHINARKHTHPGEESIRTDDINAILRAIEKRRRLKRGKARKTGKEKTGL